MALENSIISVYLKRKFVKFAEQFNDFTVVYIKHVGDTEAAYFDNISAEDVNLFLLSRCTNSLFLYFWGYGRSLSGWQAQ